MIEHQATIKNQQGIHCRPSAVIMKTLEGYDGTIRLHCEKGDCDQLTILGLMSLGLEFDDTITIQVEGRDEEHVCKELTELFETEFDFPPQGIP